MQRPALSEVSIRLLSSGDQLGPIIFSSRSAVDLNPGAEAPLSARCSFDGRETRAQGHRVSALSFADSSSISPRPSTFPNAYLAVETFRAAATAV